MKDSHSHLSILANSRPRVMGNKCILVKRTLSGAGKIMVKKNEEVAPHDILGKSKLSSGFSAINIAKQLRVYPSEGQKYLQKPTGTIIYKGELLASKKTMFGKKYITSPTDGTIEEYNPKSGELRLKFLPRDIPLTSGVFGIVEDIDDERGEVILKTMVSEIYGVFGFGKERSGILHIITNQSNLMDASQINDHLNKQIVVTGVLTYMEVLRKAASTGIQALISGGINARDFSSITGGLNTGTGLNNDVGITVFGTEGFGPVPIGDDIFKVLKANEGKFIFVNGNRRVIRIPTSSIDSLISLRKIVLPPDSVDEEVPPLQVGEIKIGSKVRIIWPPLMGVQGIVIGVDKTPTVLESGISIYMVAVETAKQKIKVAYPNLELIS